MYQVQVNKYWGTKKRENVLAKNKFKVWPGVKSTNPLQFKLQRDQR